MMFISPRSHRDIVNYIAQKGAQWPVISNEMVTNGRVGKIAGVQLVVSRSVATSTALVVIPKRVGTWKSAYPLSTDVTTDPYKSVRIRAVEVGVTQITDPNAAVLIHNI